MPRGQQVKISKCCKYFVCECGYTSSNKTGIRLHEKAAHGTNINPKDLDRKDIDSYTCRICKKSPAPNTSYKHTENTQNMPPATTTSQPALRGKVERYLV